MTPEIRRGGIGLSGITPSGIVYGRNNMPSIIEEQVADREAWEIAFEGVGEQLT